MVLFDEPEFRQFRFPSQMPVKQAYYTGHISVLVDVIDHFRFDKPTTRPMLIIMCVNMHCRDMTGLVVFGERSVQQLCAPDVQLKRQIFADGVMEESLFLWSSYCNGWVVTSFGTGGLGKSPEELAEEGGLLAYVERCRYDASRTIPTQEAGARA